MRIADIDIVGQIGINNIREDPKETRSRIHTDEGQNAELTAMFNEVRYNNWSFQKPMVKLMGLQAQKIRLHSLGGGNNPQSGLINKLNGLE